MLNNICKIQCFYCLESFSNALCTGTRFYQWLVQVVHVVAFMSLHLFTVRLCRRQKGKWSEWRWNLTLPCAQRGWCNTLSLKARREGWSWRIIIKSYWLLTIRVGKKSYAAFRKHYQFSYRTDVSFNVFIVGNIACFFKLYVLFQTYFISSVTIPIIGWLILYLQFI